MNADRSRKLEQQMRRVLGRLGGLGRCMSTRATRRLAARCATADQAGRRVIGEDWGQIASGREGAFKLIREGCLGSDSAVFVSQRQGPPGQQVR